MTDTVLLPVVHAHLVVEEGKDRDIMAVRTIVQDLRTVMAVDGVETRTEGAMPIRATIGGRDLRLLVNLGEAKALQQVAGGVEADTRAAQARDAVTDTTAIATMPIERREFPLPEAGWEATSIARLVTKLTVSDTRCTRCFQCQAVSRARKNAAHKDPDPVLPDDRLTIKQSSRCPSNTTLPFFVVDFFFSSSPHKFSSLSLLLRPLQNFAVPPFNCPSKTSNTAFFLFSRYPIIKALKTFVCLQKAFVPRLASTSQKHVCEEKAARRASQRNKNGVANLAKAARRQGNIVKATMVPKQLEKCVLSTGSSVVCKIDNLRKEGRPM